LDTEVPSSGGAGDSLVEAPSSPHGIVTVARPVEANLDERQRANDVRFSRNEDPIRIHGGGNSSLGEPANDLVDVLMRQRIATVKMDAEHAKTAKLVQSHGDLLTGQLIAHGRLPMPLATGQIAEPRDFKGEGQG